MGHFYMHLELHPKSQMESHRSQIQRMKISPHFHNQKTMVNGFCLIVSQFEAQAKPDLQEQSWIRTQTNAQVELISVIRGPYVP